MVQWEIKLRAALERWPILKVLFGYLVLVVIAFAPIVPAFFAGSVGALLGCNINEAGTDPCVRLGIPLGDTLSVMGIMAWFALITIPLAMLGAALWTLTSIKILFFRKK